MSDATVTPAGSRTPGAVRRRFHVSGVVQGVGFRPFVHATATALGLSGTVCNTSEGVVIEVEGPPDTLAAFAARLTTDPPPLAAIDHVQVTDLPPTGAVGFAITVSRHTTGRTLAAPDTATCDACLRELADPADRRHRHPFITCTHCGPRFTIITALPYDRPATTMAAFPLCAACAREYADPADRRFHAQPIACPDCGPRLTFTRADGTTVTDDDAAMAAARQMLAAGGIVAVKGLGGYHLACDATNGTAVASLRRRKRRGAKPFAVMLADLALARDTVDLDATATALLTGPARPIVLAPRRPDARTPIADAVAPGNPDLGVLLPYTPVHHLLFGLPDDPPGPRALVMTSGNVSGEPIVTDDAEARQRLTPLADGWLSHDRPIRVPCDDSVVRVVDGAELVLRRSRGYVPLALPLPFEVPPTLAVGGDLKNTCCVAAGRSAWLSGHLGDMADMATLTAFDGVEQHLEQLTGVTPTLLAADAHPDHRSRAWALRHAADRPVTFVQHHHAHVASLLGEHGHDGAQPVIGVAFDGTGYGTDGAIWGGELLVADYGGFRRFAHLAYVPLPGGDAAVRRPYRMALAHLHAAGIAWDDDLPPVAACPEGERRVLARQLDRGLGCVPTSSMGRLFDAVSALLGLRPTVDFEAQAAIELESRARAAVSGDAPGYRFRLRGAAPDHPVAADPAPVLRALVDDLRAGAGVDVAARRFHDAVAALVVELACRAREETGLDTVGLTGGVFQNALLLTATAAALNTAGFTVLRHQRVPPGDGGLAFGQVLVAAATEHGKE